MQHSRNSRTGSNKNSYALCVRERMCAPPSPFPFTIFAQVFGAEVEDALERARTETMLRAPHNRWMNVRARGWLVGYFARANRARELTNSPARHAGTHLSPSTQQQQQQRHEHRARVHTRTHADIFNLIIMNV